MSELPDEVSMLTSSLNRSRLSAHSMICKPALSQCMEGLLRSFQYAQDVDADLWEFALKSDELIGGCLNKSDLRWLVVKGFMEHRYELSVSEDFVRLFSDPVLGEITEHSCFVITASGIQMMKEARNYKASFLSEPKSLEKELWEGPRIVTGGIPVWHPDVRELRFGGELVKQYRVPARNQELILEIFEEDGWPTHIDDPLPPSRDVDSRSRLQNAIQRLNQKQLNPALRFRGNGNGNGVYWEAV